jgi:hypothetical protein
MTQYVTKSEYTSLGGTSLSGLSDAEIDKWLKLASLKVDTITFNRIDLSTISAYQLEYVKLATVYEADYLYSIDSTVGLDEALSGWSVTDISLSYQQNVGSVKWYKDNNISRMAVEFLDKSGLTWRGI